MFIEVYFNRIEVYFNRIKVMEGRNPNLPSEHGIQNWFPKPSAGAYRKLGGFPASTRMPEVSKRAISFLS